MSFGAAGVVGEVTALGGTKNDVLLGDNADDRLEGREGEDTLSGLGGNDRLQGEQGDDTLTGGSGDDLFIFADGDGVDVITDFAAGTGTDDVISLALVSSLNNFADVQASTNNVGSDVDIDFGSGNSLTLLGVNLVNLASDDFLF